MDGRMQGVASRPVLAGIGRTDAYQRRKIVVRADRVRVKVDAVGDCVPIAADRVDGVFHVLFATPAIVLHTDSRSSGEKLAGQVPLLLTNLNAAGPRRALGHSAAHAVRARVRRTNKWHVHPIATGQQ